METLNTGHGDEREPEHGHGPENGRGPRTGHGPEHGHGHGHGHEHGHPAGARLRHRLAHLARPHSHDAAARVDRVMESSARGVRTLWVSLAGLGGTAAAQAAVVAVSGSVALLGDTIHNAADALTALPLGVAFLAGRRPATRRFTYGFGRAEDIAGIFIVALIALSSALAATAAISRLLHPATVSYLPAVAAAAVIGFLGNEGVARYRIRVGREIGSAALIADGLHARTDGFTSLAVLFGAAGAALGWRQADPVIGLVITVAILFVLKSAAEEVFRRLMDAVDPALLETAESALGGVDGVIEVQPAAHALDRPSPARRGHHRGRRRAQRPGRALRRGRRRACAAARHPPADRGAGARRPGIRRSRRPARPARPPPPGRTHLSAWPSPGRTAVSRVPAASRAV